LALVRGEAAFADRQAWIAALIADLDQVTYLATGEFDDELDPVMVALIDCGDDAVEPLLDCMAHDERLTRNGLPPTRVETAAYQALMQILQIRDFGKEPAHNGTLTEAQQRQQMVQIIRDYFMKVKGLSPSQRWLTVLRDDDGDWLEWNYAADHLQDLIDNAKHRRDDNSQRVANGLTHAMVDALSARIQKMNKAGNETEASYTLKRMADRDMNTVKPLIAMQLHVLLNLEDDQGRSIDMITHFTPLLARAGDRSALQAYMKWIIGQKPDVVGMDALAPLWMFPDDPEMARTAELMFSFSPSNWNPLDIRQYRESIKTPLLGIPGFRAQVVKALADQTADGTATVLADHGLRLVDRDGNVDRNPRSEHIGRSETHMGPVGKEMTLRMCDRIATEISQIGGGPEMKLYWPEEDRNAAVKACVGFLNQYGERFKYREDFDGQAMGSHSYTIAFPSLDHPASKKEAASKEAIFSLEGEGEARVVRDMKLPATARWTTLKSHPFEAPEGGKIDFDNYCWIWQAEESGIATTAWSDQMKSPGCPLRKSNLIRRWNSMETMSWGGRRFQGMLMSARHLRSAINREGLDSTLRLASRC
jgi:hypothetical protein